MINIIWAFMIIVGIGMAMFNGQMGEVNSTIIKSAGEAISLCITMLGAVGLWSGIMRIAEKSGLMENWTNKMWPIMKRLFPEVERDTKAYKYMCTNIIANIIGLGWAATPPALMAMKELRKKNKDSDKASRSMCNFLIVNISSLQLIPVNIIAYRMEYGAKEPSSVIIPGLIATCVSTTTAIIICIIANKIGEKEK